MEVAKPQDESAGTSGNSCQQDQLTFARRLASPDNKTRDKSISLLTVWLTSQDAVKEPELKKIWKGLFYCVWHADKLQVQVDLIERLASLMEKLDLELALQFFKVFLSTMRREWFGIDRLRLDKFYLLLRKYLVHMFVVLKNQGWDADYTRKFMDALEERAFLARDRYAAHGINLHYAEIFLTELQKFLPLQVETFTLLLEPFCNILAKTSEKILVNRLRESIFDHLLDLGRTVIKAKQEGQELDVCVENLGSLALTVPITSVLFNLAALPSTPQLNRKILYELHSEFSKLEKFLAFSGVTICTPIVTKKSILSGENASGDQSEDLGGSYQVTANGLVEDTGGCAKMENHSRKVKTRKKLAKRSEKRRRVSRIGTHYAVMQEANEYLPPSQEVGVSLKKEHGEAFQAQEEKDETTGERVLFPEMKLTLSKGKVFGNRVPESISERERDGTGSAELYRKKRRSKGLKNIKGNMIPTLEAETLQGEIAEHKSSGGRKAIEACSVGCVDDLGLRVLHDEDCLDLDDLVVSNLKNRFDSIAAEGSSNLDTCGSPVVFFPPVPSPKHTGSKKRKRGISSSVSPSRSDSSWSGQENGVSPRTLLLSGSSSVNNTSEKKKKKKKVRFSLKNNLEWKPYCPLPPQILRVPPSATPRGSALKKGVPPGPIIVVKDASPRPRKGGYRRTPKSLKNLARGSKSFNRFSFSPR